MDPTSVTAGQVGGDPAASRRHWWVGIGLVLVFMLIATLVAAWWLTRPEEETTPGLEALRADPMATASIPGLVQTDESNNPGHSEGDSWMGKPAPAYLRRVVRITSGDVASALRSVRKVAEGHGWKTESIDADGYTAYKKMPLESQHLAQLASLSATFDTIAYPGLQGAIILTVEAE